MNIFRVTSNSQLEGEVGLMDLFYDKNESNELRCLDLKVYSIVNNIVGDVMELNIVLKLAIAKNLLEILKKNENKNDNV